jgi:hypothetical protein
VDCVFTGGNSTTKSGILDGIYDRYLGGKLVPRIQTLTTTHCRKQSLAIGRPANFPAGLYFIDTEPPEDKSNPEGEWNETVLTL